MANRRVNATDFNSRCLSLLDEVGATGDVLTILKHGRPVAEVRPIRNDAVPFPPPDLRGSVQFHGDVVGKAIDDVDIPLDVHNV